MKHFQTKKGFLILAAVLMLSLGNNTLFAQDSTIKVGVLVSVTGPLGTMGLPCRNSTILAADQINSQGGIKVIGKTYKIELIIEDDEGKPAVAVGLVNKLIDKYDIKFINGPITGRVCLAVTPIIQKNKIITIGLSSQPNFEIDFKGAKPFYFGTCPIPEERATLLVAFIKDYFKNVKDVAVIAQTDAFSDSAGKAFAKEAKEKGLNVVAYESFEVGEKNFNLILTKIKEKKPAILYTECYPQAGGLIQKQLKEINFKTQTLDASSATAGQAFFEIGGESVRGHIGFAYSDPFNEKPKCKIFYKEFKNRYNMEPLMVGKLYYDQFFMLMEAIKAAGSISDTERIRNVLQNMRYDGVLQEYSFDERNHIYPEGCMVTFNEKGIDKVLSAWRYDRSKGWIKMN